MNCPKCEPSAKRRPWWLVALGVTLVAVFVLARRQKEPSVAGEQAAIAPTASNAAQISAAAPASSTASGLERVEPRNVCMVNDKYFGAPQIPVKVGEKTYYGCCPNCEKRLAEDDAVRSAVDPLSGQPVDKAVAVIAKDESGAALYFESDANLSAFQARRAKGTPSQN